MAKAEMAIGRVLLQYKLNEQGIYIAKKEPSYDEDGEKIYTFYFPPESLKATLREDIKYAVKRVLPSPPYTLVKTEGHFETKNADGLVIEAEDKETLAIVYKELAISDDNVNDCCRILLKGVAVGTVLILLFLWLVSKDL